METMALPLLPTRLFTAAQVLELERMAIEDQGIPAIQLMKRAGRAAFNTLVALYPALESGTGKISIYCGSGNNAGDGYVLAALAAQRNIDVEVFLVGSPPAPNALARAAFDYAEAAGVSCLAWSEENAPEEGVIVDALLGTGFKPGVLKGSYAAAIGQINNSGLPVFALDLPSGLAADSGAIGECAVNAHNTITFLGVKRGLLTAKGPAHCGELHFDDLGVEDALLERGESSLKRLDLSQFAGVLDDREADAHKGDFGHVMIIGGDVGMGGAPLMAAEAAARVGAGLVSVATRPEHVSAILARRPEVMVSGVPSGQELEPLLSKPTVLVVGPGMGRSAWSEQMLQQALKTGLPLVLDADALNIISEGRLSPKTRRDNWIITPHPGEAARLLSCTTAEVQADRFASIEALQKRFGGAVVLKGAGTLVAGPDSGLSVCNAGNAGMASGGMGDVLSGILGGLLAQGAELVDVAEWGVCLHSAAADRVAATSGQRGMLATDLLPHVRNLINL